MAATSASGRLPPGRSGAELLEARAWFDVALRARLEQHGGPPLSPTRSRAFLAMSARPIRVSDLAQQLDISRQAAHKMLDGLEQDALVERHRDDHDRRAQVVTLTQRGHALTRQAAKILKELEVGLAWRIGSEHVESLREVLAQDWGRSPT